MDETAPDGSPVAFYRRLPAMGEPELIHGAIAPGASVLELGCGAGRIAGPLSALGHRVTGVDNGAGMIEALPAEVEGIVADAGTVRLGRRFGAVVLASHLINDPGNGLAFVATAAAHLERGGVVVAETYPPGWDPAASVGVESRLGDARITMLSATVDGDILHAEVRYGIDGHVWQQPFTARILDDTTRREMFAAEGLDVLAWLDRPGWFLARVAD